MQKEEKRWYIGSLSEQTKVQSSTSGTTEELRAKHDALAQEDRSYT